ncbi:MAG TPA: phosphotransferase, partial [Stellaceae bacterium]|nr:phosphotransferase [Stellaceae bacterium]
MAENAQDDIIAFLSRGSSYGAPGEAPQRVDTHISHVFLTGDRVFKLKRAVRFSFVDYSSLAARERFCRAELALNRRTAPGLYRAVRAITRRPDGALEWDGAGPAVDFVVEMRRFDERDLFDRMAREGRLDRALVVKLADAIAAFHAAAEPAPAFGGSASLREVVADNHRYLAAGAPPLDRGTVDALLAASQVALGRVGALLDARRAEGKVKRCHGDLHLRNICLFEGGPTLFDCIEFSDDIACIDVLYDIAFLLMDLEHRGLRPLGNAVFNRYLDRAPDEAGLEALPLMLSIRAGIRAKVAVAASDTGATS